MKGNPQAMPQGMAYIVSVTHFFLAKTPTMNLPSPRLLALLPLLLAGCDRLPGNLDSSKAAARKAAIDDVVVIAVVDSGFNPYHWDYLAAKMPRHLNDDPSDDLPLDQDPATWLPGHPGAAAFKSYDALNLTLTPDDPDASTVSLQQGDAAEWSKVQWSEGSDNAQVHMVWVPGTKVIGHVAFDNGGLLGDPYTAAVLGPPTGTAATFESDSHGLGTSSVSTGNIHGACPNCLLVYVHGTTEQANRWVEKQDWIDLQTNSWGLSLTLAARDRLYAGSDTEAQRAAVERGQAIFFSAGNGLENAFVTPNPTLFSSQEGPDWIITVGGIDTDGASYTGHGRPADIASLGGSYPSASGTSGTVTQEGNFGGTSNATPVLAGMYGTVLSRVRAQIGSARMQKDGVIAQGKAGCGEANADCALADGTLTVHEMREAMFRAAQYTAAGLSPGGVAAIPNTNTAEIEFLSEGHGSYYARFNADEFYEAELARITGYLDGSWFAEQDADQRDFMIAKSVCRQAAWGSWEHGYATQGPVPAADPAWPLRTFFSELCPVVVPPVVAAERAFYGLFQ